MKQSLGLAARWSLALVISAGLVFSAQALVSPLPRSILDLTLPNLADHAWPNCASGAPAADSVGHRRIPILHDSGRERSGDRIVQATLLANLASHFGAVRVTQAGNYRAGDMLGYDALIYLGSVPREPLPGALIRDVNSGNRPVLWLKHNIDQLARPSAFLHRYGWLWKEFDGPNDFTLRYQNAKLRPSGGGVGLTTFHALDRNRAQVLGTAFVQGHGSVPWAIASKHLVYVGDLPLGTTSTRDASLALADLLHDLVPAPEPGLRDRHRALVRIEDVGPMSDPENLRAIAKAMRDAGVPYSVTVYPAYVGPVIDGRQKIVKLAERPKVVRAIAEMLDGGATMVSHGYTHQFGDRKNPRSGESGTDYEFFLSHLDSDGTIVYDGPVPGDSQEWAQARIDKALAELGNLGFPRPQMFTVPHYTASPADYAAIRSRFAARYDQGIYFSPDWDGSPPASPYLFEQSAPYLIHDSYGSVVVPENLGYVADSSETAFGPNTKHDILAGANAMLAVRDSVASFFYHPFLGTSHLMDLVAQLRGMGYTFTSPCEL